MLQPTTWQSQYTVAYFPDMLEESDDFEIHVGLMPALINNQVDIIFGFTQFYRGMCARCSNY